MSSSLKERKGSRTYLLLDPTFSSQPTTLEIIDMLQDAIERGHVGSEVGGIGAGSRK